MASCSTTWCQWLQSSAQIAVALVILYSGYIVNSHMQSWTEAFNRGSDDLHNVSVAMSDIRRDMSVIRNEMKGMNQNTAALNERMEHLNVKMDQMNARVGQIQNRMSPMGMMRGMMPF